MRACVCVCVCVRARLFMGSDEKDTESNVAVRLGFDRSPVSVYH